MIDRERERERERERKLTRIHLAYMNFINICVLHYFFQIINDEIQENYHHQIKIRKQNWLHHQKKKKSS